MNFTLFVLYIFNVLTSYAIIALCLKTLFPVIVLSWLAAGQPLIGFWMSDGHIHIIAPTLFDETGHCHSFVASLCCMGKKEDFLLWVAKNAFLPGLDGNFEIRRYFQRMIRKVQSYFLYRQLIGKKQTIFLPTAGTLDLFLINWAAGSPVPKNKVYLYFHWVRMSPSKADRLRRLSRKQPNIVILGPTQSVVDVFQSCGFERNHLVPYPITPFLNVPPVSEPFRHILFAGAARKDKGFSTIVDFVSFLAVAESTIPVTLQVSASHYQKYDQTTIKDIERLYSLSYPFLTIISKTLDSRAYLDLFRGAISLQPYDRHDFADRISGVTLDSLSVGCPVITVSGTWMGRVVKRFGAGAVVESVTPENLLSAVKSILLDYPRFRKNACDAGRILQSENTAEILYRVLLGKTTTN